MSEATGSPDATASPDATGSPVDRCVAFEEIRQLAARYALAIDQRDLDTLVDLFVPDVRVGTDRTGHDALRAEFTTSLRAIGVSILQVGTHVIDLVDHDAATGIVYCTAEIQDGERWIRQAIAYDDTYRRVNGSWRFVRRIHRLFYGINTATRPLDQGPANWPEHPDGVGTLPEAWPTWRAFWGEAHPLD